MIVLPLNIRLSSVLASPSRPEHFWFLPGSSLLARMQYERLGRHRSFSHADEPNAINCDHGCFLRLNASKFPGKEDERILVVGIHVLNDLDH